ncbi:MAG: hypothetical protein JNL71_00045 [Rhodospirillales bacterium]|nr:hypothetical protein [Rhodospirillales bacterium]
MYPGGYAEQGEFTERRYLVATLLYDAWLPRALERQLPDAERKAFYWSGIYGAARTRISEVWVQARQQHRAPPPRTVEPIPTISVTVEPPPRTFWNRLGRLDVPVDPAYAKAMADAFLVYVGSQLALRVLANMKFAASLV